MAKAMLGPQKQYYAWLGCLQGNNTASIGMNVKVQQFANGYVIEGILNPPQSMYRNRIILINGGRWEQEFIDKSGKFVSTTPNYFPAQKSLFAKTGEGLTGAQKQKGPLGLVSGRASYTV